MSVIFSPAVNWQGMMSNKLYNQFYTALHKSNLNKVRHLILNDGIAANHQFADGSFPLHIAADHQEFEILKLLLSLRASPDFKNRHGQTPLMLGITQGSRSIEIVQALVNYGCKVNLCDKQKRTALHLAGSKALVEVMKILLTAGARVNTTDEWGRSPLHVTLLNLSHRHQQHYVEAVELLLCSGADSNLSDKKQTTPLFLTVAAGDQCARVFHLLISHGAHPDKPSKHKLTPLMLAVMKGHALMVKLLVQHNCNVNAFNQVTKRSCLYQAVQKGYMDIAKCLVEGGTDLWRQSWIFYEAYTKVVHPDSDMAVWLRSMAAQPQSLRHLCRTRIRRTFPVGKLDAKLKHLQYPEILKQYILLME